METGENKSVAATDVIWPGCGDFKGELWFHEGIRPFSDGPSHQDFNAQPGTFFALEGKDEMVSGPPFDLGLKPGCGGRLNPKTFTWTKYCNAESN